MIQQTIVLKRECERSGHQKQSAGFEQEYKVVCNQRDLKGLSRETFVTVDRFLY